MTAVKKTLFIIILSLTLLAVLSMVGDDASADTHTLSAPGNADSGTVWDTGTAPEAGDDLILTGAYDLLLNQAIDYGNITLDVSYSGIATQGSVDFGYHDLTIAAGTWKGVNTNTQTCSGSFVRSGGTITPNVLKIVFVGEVETYNANAQFKSFTNTGNLTLTNGLVMSETGYTFINSGTIDIQTGKVVFIYHYTGTNSFTNTGIIYGPGKIGIYSKIDGVYNFGTSLAPLEIYLFSTASTSRTAMISSDATLYSLKVSSQHATYTMTLDASGYNISAGAIIIGMRGILQCGEGQFICDSLTSSLGVVNEETATWLFGNNSLITMAEGAELYDVLVDGDTIRIGQTTTVHSLSFTGLLSSHPYGLYINGTRTSSVTTTSSGSYLLGSGAFAWDNATLKITPMLSQVSGGALEIYKGLAYWNDYDSSVDVVWTFTSGASWLSMNDGNITGTPTRDGNYTYTLTATHANGELATVSGYVLVETSTVQELNYQIGPLLALVVGVLAISLVVDTLNKAKKRFK